jgi:hypothetical protein
MVIAQPLSIRVERLLSFSIFDEPIPRPDPEGTRGINYHRGNALVWRQSERELPPPPAILGAGWRDEFKHLMLIGDEQPPLTIFDYAYPKPEAAPTVGESRHIRDGRPVWGDELELRVMP